MFEIKADLDYMKYFLIMHDKTELLEQFYHNQVLKKYLRDPEVYMRKYPILNLIEHMHGRDKKHTEIKNIQATDIDKFTAHLCMHIISTLALALVRLQNGETKHLTYRGGLI